MFCPKTSIVPELGLVSSRAHFIRVDLPAPFDPIMDTASPESTFKSTPLSTTLEP